jgi:hypothetical protein
LISRLSGPLDPDDRSSFRQAAERALGAPGCWGEGSAYRALLPLWRGYFHPPPDGVHLGPNPHHRQSKIKSGAALA